MTVTVTGSSITFPTSSNGQSGSGTQSSAASGWKKLPSGLLIQWGTFGALAYNANATMNYTTSFPVAFGTTPSRIYAAYSDTTSGAWGRNIMLRDFSTTGFRLVAGSMNNGTNGLTSTVRWFAIGY
jgi:hypothetical protein